MTGDNGKSKKKKSRWGGTENDKTFIPGMPTILPATLDAHQQEAYLGEIQLVLIHFSLILLDDKLLILNEINN